ncbi:(3,5-dihydroxyphenyl)acetyl-CoA 1,2-dioxygenase DpgC [Streptomyces sp. NPDC047917]|uniref:(3,5-dihydroxyphenyl)acetyl-CoA 1,2-dioxygenase DpgC n=1 Tax=Streptomyces sp. NPDC047917 TaxID=3365491 RepID=UPI0037127C2C
MSPRLASARLSWDVPAPKFTGVLRTDAALLTAYVQAGEHHLGLLPPRPHRAGDQQPGAEHILALTRAARRAFITLHTTEIYDQLTDDRTRYLRVDALLAAAAESFPGLVPDQAQVVAEAARIQAHKDGREVDQAMFCGAVLRSATAGTHLIEAMLLPTAGACELLEEFRRVGRIALSTVVVERKGQAAYVTFRNAHCLNAEDNRLIADLETAVDVVLLDDQVRVGVLRGGEVDHRRYAGRRVFSAGINLKDLRNGDISFVDFLLGRELGYIHKMARGLLVNPAEAAWADRCTSKPWVGAVESFAIGGGMQLLLVLDRVIAESEAFFSLPAAEEGIVPGLGNLRLTRMVGTRLARQIILQGRTIHAKDPEASLICDEVVSSSGMESAIDRAVQELSAPAVAANRSMLFLAEEPLDLYRTYLAEFAIAQASRAYSPDVLDKVERRWQQSQTRN